MNEGNLRELLATLDVEVVHKNSRGWLVASCPLAFALHEHGTDSNPSFMVKVNPTGYSGFNCYTCHQHGNLSKLLQKLGHYREEDYGYLSMKAMADETPESFGEWEDMRGCFEEEDTMDPLDAELYLRMYPLAWEEELARQYLLRREVSEEAAYLLDLRYDPELKRILFPVYDSQRNLYGFTGRSTFPNPKIKVKDYGGLRKEKALLGEHLVEDGKPFLVVEGLFALARMVTVGVPAFAVPVATMGSFMSDTQRDILSSYLRPVYMLYDDDKAGEDGLFGDPEDPESIGAFQKLKGHVPVYICPYPKEKTDPDRLTLEEVRRAIAQAYDNPEL